MLSSILVVLRGTLIAQLIGFASLPLLTRLFSPEAFGGYQLFMSVLGIVLVTAAMRYEIALLNVSGGSLAVTLRLCVWVNVAMAGIATAVCAGLIAVGPRWLSGRETLLYLAPFGFLIGGLQNTLGYLLLRDKDFGASARVKVAQVVCYVLVALAIGFLLPSTFSLVLADCAGRLASVVMMVTWAMRHNIGIFDNVQRSALRGEAVRHKEFPFVSVPGGLVNAVGAALPAAFIFAAFDASVLGQYSLVDRSVFLPVGLISQAAAQVFTANFAAQYRDGQSDMNAEYRSVLRNMFLIGLAPALVVFFGAPILIPMVFGEQWRLAGQFAQIMSPMVLVGFAAGAVNMTLLLAGKQRIQFTWEVIRLAAVLIVWSAVFNLRLSPLTAMKLNAAGGVLVYLTFFWMADRVTRQLPTVPSVFKTSAFKNWSK
jgi:O-antigen/teichoic acid export membrane protein